MILLSCEKFKLLQATALSTFTGLQEFIHDLLCMYLVGPEPVGCNHDFTDLPDFRVG